MTKQDRVVHSSPLLELEGVGFGSYCIDLLHCWHLGPLADFIGMALWYILDNKLLFDDIPWLDSAHCHKLGLMQIKSRLTADYRHRRQIDEAWSKKGGRIWNLTLKMLGKPSDPSLSAKGAETLSLLEFTIAELERLMPKIRLLSESKCFVGGCLAAAGKAANQFEAILHDSPRNMPLDARVKLFNAYMQFFSLFIRSGGSAKPKFHMMLHCIKRTANLPNPLFYHNYRDESLNGVIAKIARSVHSWSFCLQTHRKFAIMQELGVRSAIT